MKLPALLAVSMACTAALLGSAAEPVTPLSLDAMKLEDLANPFLLLTPPEIQALKARIAQEPETQVMYANLMARAQGFVAKPLRFPEREGGPRNALLCTECKSSLVYNPESPHRHFCPKCKEWREGERLDQAWNTTTFFELSNRMELLGAMALLSGDAPLASALKETWLDLAAKYPKYRLHEKGMQFTDQAPPTAALATCQSIEEAYLITKLATSWDALLGTKVLSAAEQESIEKNFWKVADTYFHRVLELHGSGGNWWVWHSSGALSTGLFSKDRQLIDKAFNMPSCGIIPFLATGYLHSDGFVEERSASYQGFAMEALSRMAQISQRVGLEFHHDPRIRAGFTAYSQLLLPDLSLPCLNDTGRFRFTIADGSENLGWERYLNLLDLGWNIYHSPEILHSFQVLQNSPAVAKNREQRLSALIYGPREIKPAPLDMPSFYTAESGIALLRSPEKDWTLLLKNSLPRSGHCHPDALQIAMFANGEEFLPAFGAGNYGLRFYPDWFSQTLASNSVVANRISQAIGGSENRLDWGITRGPVQAVHATASKIQGPADPGSPIKLSRLVLLTPMAMYEILRVAPDASIKTKKATVEVNQLDAVLHFSGNLAWTPAAASASAPWEIPSVESLQADFQKTRKAEPAKKLRFHDHHVPYRLLEKPESLQASADGFLHGELSQPKGGKVALALFPLAAGESTWQFMGPGFEFEATKALPLVIRHLTANAARFGTVALPFREQNPLRSVKLALDTPTASVLRLETSHGSETVFSCASQNALHLAEIHCDFDGLLGVITEAPNAPRIYTLIGNSLGDSMGHLTADAPVAVQMIWDGTKAEFSNLGAETVNVSWTPAGGGPVVRKTLTRQRN